MFAKASRNQVKRLPPVFFGAMMMLHVDAQGTRSAMRHNPIVLIGTVSQAEQVDVATLKPPDTW